MGTTGSNLAADMNEQPARSENTQAEVWQVQVKKAEQTDPLEVELENRKKALEFLKSEYHSNQIKVLDAKELLKRAEGNLALLTVVVKKYTDELEDCEIRLEKKKRSEDSGRRVK